MGADDVSLPCRLGPAVLAGLVGAVSYLLGDRIPSPLGSR
jgi:hypothetical protein